MNSAVVPHAVTRATGEHVETVATTLAHAFALGDYARWLIPDVEERMARYPGYFRIFARGYVAQYTVEMAGDGVGVALWARLGRNQVAEIPGYEDAIVRALGPEHLPRFGMLDEALDRAHRADREHDYLALLAVHPDHQGKGIGSSLLAHRLALCDREGRGAHLEATGPRNRALYERHGFRQRDPTMPLGPDGLQVIPMWREPRQG